MRLYYFTSEQFGLEAIQNRRLKLARLNELNDPFEWLGTATNAKERKHFQKMKNEAHEQIGLICMSKSWQHPLLWGHYAASHTGICLGFEVTVSADFNEVTYVKERISPDFYQAKIDVSPSKPSISLSILKFARTKFDAWDYEKEYRAFFELKVPDPISGLYFQPFEDKMTLCEIIVGARSSITRARLDQVLDSYSNVQAIKARAGFKKFKVVKNRRKTAWK